MGKTVELNNFKDIITKLGLDFDKWTCLEDIDSIEFNDGTAIYPDFSHLRFRITNKYEIDIKFGKSEPFGGIISPYSISYDNTTIRLTPQAITPTRYFDKVSLPKQLDIVRVSYNRIVLSESIIVDVQYAMNGIFIKLNKPLEINNTQPGILSYYDRSKCKSDSSIGNIEDGVYLNFIPNDIAKKRDYHLKIKAKDIKKIVLKYGARINKKLELN